MVPLGRARLTAEPIRDVAPFACFGVFQGAPGRGAVVRDQADLTDGQLGTALLFVGIWAQLLGIPAMASQNPPSHTSMVHRWGVATTS